MSEALEALARRLEDDPFFLAALLAPFRDSRQLDDAGLAAHLGCPPTELPLVKLCRAPREEPPGFQEDVEVIAQHFGLPFERLAEAVRFGQVLRRMRGPAGQAGGGTLMAARDGEEPEEEP